MMATSTVPLATPPSAGLLSSYLGSGELNHDSIRTDDDRRTARDRYADGYPANRSNWRPGRRELDALFHDELMVCGR